MHEHMHTIQSSAYPILTVHMTYAHCCIRLYVPVCACITLSYALYPVHMCLYVRSIQATYVQIHTDMRSQGEFISDCIFVKNTVCACITCIMYASCMYVCIACICIYHQYICVSVCICMYLHVSHYCLYMSVLYVFVCI